MARAAVILYKSTMHSLCSKTTTLNLEQRGFGRLTSRFPAHGSSYEHEMREVTIERVNFSPKAASDKEGK
jgi:hypothetical protein